MNDENQAHRERGLAAHSDSFGPTFPQAGDLAAAVRALTQLNDASSRLWHVSSLQDGLQEILRAAIALLGGDKGTVQLLGADGLLRLAAHSGFEDVSLERFDDVRPDDDSCHVVRAAIVNRDGRQLGIISAHLRAPQRPSEDSLHLLDLYVRQAADFIDRCNAREQLRQSEQRLQALSDIAADRARAEEALKDTNRRKDEFLAVLGHELRNPLAPLSTAADLLEYAERRPDLVDIVRPMMRRQIDHLTRLVDDLLDVSRISRGHAALQRAPLDLRTAVESAIEQSEPLIAAQRHRLRVHLGDVPLRADGDFQRLTQVFVNLLSNAARYSAPGSEIIVHAATDGDEALICVADRGFGIPQERVQEVFEMFSQVPEHRSLVGSGGLGIGLALCRQLVELHGGAIAAQSEGLGKGSEFSVRLPLAAVGPDDCLPVVETERIHAPRRRVLVVDDNVDAATALCMVLEQQGHDARAVFDGAAALESLAERDADVVLLDLGMPIIDGFEVARRIRQLPNGRQVLLVALTGWGQDQDRRRTAEAGFDEHLTKPVDSAQLSMLLTLDGSDGSAARRAGPNAVLGSAKGSSRASRRQS